MNTEHRQLNTEVAGFLTPNQLADFTLSRTNPDIWHYWHPALPNQAPPIGNRDSVRVNSYLRKKRETT